MLINRDSRNWIVLCTLVLAASVAVYVPYARRSVTGPSGASVIGLTFGSIGFAMMLFALLLGLRKRFRTLRVGRAYWWLQGHVWLGLLAYPIILLHAGLHFGGPMTQILMWLFTVVVVSGIFGLVLQQIMPTRLQRTVPQETIFDEVDRVVEKLQSEASALVAAVVGQRGAATDYDEASAGGGLGTATLPAVASTGAATLSEFYEKEVKPYLQAHVPSDAKLAHERSAEALFDRMRDMLPIALVEPLGDLQQIVDERRQLARQVRLHHWLHGWLFVHVPLSYGLMILATYHAIYAFRYTGVLH